MDEWDRRLARVRTALGLQQGPFAAKIGASQSDVSRWESGKKDIPQRVRKYIERHEVDLNLIDVALPVDEEIHSPKFCFGATTFKRLWAESKKRIRHMSADAVIRPCEPRVQGFANVEMTIRFEGVKLPPNDPLYLDCLGVMPEIQWKGNQFYFDKRKGSELTWVSRKTNRDADDTVGTVEEVEKVQAALGPYALGYQLLNVVEDQPIEVTIKGERGVHADEIDAIGVPVYADCPVEFLSLSVTFVNLRPIPSPKAQVYLLRRTLVDSHPLHLVGGLDVTAIDEVSQKFSFQKLRYPRPGFGFCIAWGKLK